MELSLFLVTVGDIKTEKVLQDLCICLYLKYLLMYKQQ